VITIGIPSYDHIKTETVISLLAIATTSKLPLHFVLNQGLYIDYNRNQIVDMAIANGSECLMFIDSDISFPPDGIQRLLDHDKDIIGGYYNTRRGNNPVRVFDEAGNVVIRDIPSEPFQCAVLPTGFMLIQLSCLAKLQRPYFNTITHTKGTIGEDVVFCKAATDAGLEIWCDPTIPLGHVGKKIY
jgi:glycosyltransferase involved in cell wall biosynthesis